MAGGGVRLSPAPRNAAAQPAAAPLLAALAAAYAACDAAAAQVSFARRLLLLTAYQLILTIIAPNDPLPTTYRATYHRTHCLYTRLQVAVRPSTAAFIPSSAIPRAAVGTGDDCKRCRFNLV